MSHQALPILFLNMGGEMMYILEQRLKAQSISKEKSSKVVHDIVCTMLNKRFMEEIFKKQELYGRKAIRTMFDRLAHASIMRLNSASMDKLYDLMTMAVKYQIALAPRPKDVLLVTLNHLDTFREMVSESTQASALVENVYRLFLNNFRHASMADLYFLRQTLLNFFQDIHVRVSIFLKDKSQSSNGRFVLDTSGRLAFGIQVPGTIKRDSKVVSSFAVKKNYFVWGDEPSFESTGNRGIKLGKNMYCNSGSASIKSVQSTSNPEVGASSSSDDSDISSAPDPNASAQMNFLMKLIGEGEDAKPDNEFKLNLFTSEQKEEEDMDMLLKQSKEPAVISFNTEKTSNDALSEIIKEMSIGTASTNKLSGDDLLNLMDN